MREMTKTQEAAYLSVLEVLKTNGCIAGFTGGEREFVPEWLPGGAERAGAELLSNPKPLGLRRSRRAYLMLLLPIEKRKELDEIILARIKKQMGV
jgi:hypothetical protein